MPRIMFDDSRIIEKLLSFLNAAVKMNFQGNAC